MQIKNYKGKENIKSALSIYKGELNIHKLILDNSANNVIGRI